jgi:hypothetical protein
MARETASICFCPPESLPAGWFLDGEVGEDAHVLGHVGNAQGGDLRRVQGRDVLVAEAHAALRGMPQAHDGPQRGGLAGAVAPEQHGELALGHGEIDAVEDVVCADMGVDALEAQQIRAHGCGSFATPR